MGNPEQDVIEQFLHRLSNNSILSAPFVIDQKIIFVDVLKILSAFVKYFNSLEPNLLTHDICMADSMPWFNSLVKTSGLLETSNLSSQHVPMNCTIFEAASKLYDSKNHRIALVNETYIPEDIFSQSDFVYLFHKDIDHFSDLVDGPIESLGVITKPVITISEKKTAMSALEVLTHNQIGAVVVVDKEHKFIDTIAFEDFRGFRRENWLLLERPVLLFKEFCTKRKAISCNEKTNFKEMISLLVNNSTHQICVVDDQGKATGIVTLTNIIAYVLSKVQ